MLYNLCVLEMNYNRFREKFAPFACFSNKQVLSVFPDFNRGNYYEWLRHGYIVHLRQGWYAFSEAKSISGISDYIAGRIYSPSYLSCEYVMARCGLIPESVVQITSVTSLKTSSFQNDFGEFFYRSVKPELMFGYDVQTIGHELPVMVASLQKALCDFLYLNPRYDNEEEIEELRFDDSVLEELFDSEALSLIVDRFGSTALRKRIELVRKVYLR